MLLSMTVAMSTICLSAVCWDCLYEEFSCIKLWTLIYIYCTLIQYLMMGLRFRQMTPEERVELSWGERYEMHNKGCRIVLDYVLGCCTKLSRDNVTGKCHWKERRKESHILWNLDHINSLLLSSSSTLASFWIH